MTFKYNNVYLNETSTVAGPVEKEGPLGKNFDNTYDDMYMGESSFEKAEVKLVKECIDILLKKTSLSGNDIDIVVGGDLNNQITASTYGTSGIGNGYIGVYGACSSVVMGMIVASNFIDKGLINNAIVEVSSHNSSAEKQFRNPVEYGAPKKDSATFTSTGAAACLLSNEKSNVRVDCATLGVITDYKQNDVNDMGRVMSPAVYETLKRHFKDTGRDFSYYDLVLTGDLGKYGKKIVKDMFSEYNTSNYNDCGVMLYDIEKQKEVHAGGSGPVCSALVSFSVIFDRLRKKKLNKVLIIATGALFSPTTIHQKEDIYSIANAISLEVK